MEANTVGSQDLESGVQESQRKTGELKANTPWLVLVNAPISSLAHDALFNLLVQTDHALRGLILLGPAAAAARKDSPLAERYSRLAKQHQLDLRVCGMAARNYGAEQEGLSENFKLTGFMEILLEVKKAKKAGAKVVVW